VDSDAVAAAVNGLSSLLSVIDSITEKTNVLGTAEILSGLLMNAKGIGGHISSQWQLYRAHSSKAA